MINQWFIYFSVAANGFVSMVKRHADTTQCEHIFLLLFFYFNSNTKRVKWITISVHKVCVFLALFSGEDSAAYSFDAMRKWCVALQICISYHIRHYFIESFIGVVFKHSRNWIVCNECQREMLFDDYLLQIYDTIYAFSLVWLFCVYCYALVERVRQAAHDARQRIKSSRWYCRRHFYSI